MPYFDLAGDAWIDCDELITPDGASLLFFTTEIGNAPAAVFIDADALGDNDRRFICRFVSDIVPQGLYKKLTPETLRAITLDEIGEDLPAGRRIDGWREWLKAYARKNGCRIIAYRGGVGYTYAIYREPSI